MTQLSELVHTGAELGDRADTIGGLLAAVAEADPRRPALVQATDGATRRWTYGELYDDASAIAGALRRLCAPGDRVAVCGPNVAEWVIVELGAAIGGFPVVGLNPALTESEMSYLVAQSGAALVVTAGEYRGADLAGLFERLREEVPRLKTVLPLETALGWGRTPDPSPSPTAVRPDDPLLVQYTSGTTGSPKGAILTHGGITLDMCLTVARFAVGPEAVWLGVIPMHHLTGSVANTIGALVSGGAQVLATWSPGDVLRLIEQERVTVLQAVPTMLLALLEHPDFDTTDLSSLDLIVSGGTVVQPELVTRCEQRFGCDFAVIFGQTEAGAYIATTRRTDSVSDRTERVGTPLECFDVRVVDPGSGEIVACGSIGEFWLRGPSVMSGYHNLPEQTAMTLDGDGWMRTGDLGFMDERGYLQVTGKLKDVIIRSGVNVYPGEVERRLAGHPDVADVAVVGLADDRLGEQVGAFVRMAPGRPLDGDALAAFARQSLAAYKVPSVWRSVDELPLTASGKVKKYQLRADFEAGRW